MSEVSADVQRARDLYATGRAAKTGDAIVCPVCNTTFGKINYQQVFCSNEGSGNCKDHYWNLIAERNPLTGYRPKTNYEKLVKQLAKAEEMMTAAIIEVQASGKPGHADRLRELQKNIKGVINGAR